MADAGHKETEEILAGIEKRIAQEYKQAEKEVAAKLDDYLKRFETKDKLKRKALDNGLITQEEYDKWRIGQIMIGERWTKMRDSIAQDFTNASEIAKGIAFDKMPDVYALNFNYGTYQVEKGARMDTSFTLYDRNAVQELMKNEDTFIPAPGKKVQRDINEGKTLAWNKKQVQSVMLQGILQGESIPNLATRLAKTVGDSDRKASIRNARTMTTGVQNAGRVASYERANDMGIETQKQWLATLDDRTRHEHAALDGVTVPYDEPFENEYGEIDYPGDPAADPGNIFNCRCTLIASIKGFERDLSDKCQRDDRLGDMSYDDWKAGHYEQRSDSITKQDEIAETMKWVYGEEYSNYKNVIDNDDSQDVNQIYDFIFTTNPNIPINKDQKDKDISTVISAIDDLPVKVRRKMQDVEFEFGNDRSMCSPADKKIYVGINAEKEEIIHEFGHLVEYYFMDSQKVDDYKNYLVAGLGKDDIIINTYYDKLGNGVKVFGLNGSRFESQYQSRLYIGKIEDALNLDGTINTSLMFETISEPFRKYLNGEPIGNKIKILIEEAIS